MRKIQFPRMAIPLVGRADASFNLALNRLVVLVFALAPASADVELAPGVPLIALLAVLTPARRCCSRRCTSATATSRPIWDVCSQALFYATPVIYMIDSISTRRTGSST